MAHFGGWIDDVMMRIIEVINSLPSLLITILIMMVLGNNLFALLVALSITAWCSTARQVRGMIKQLKESEYVYAAEVLGAKPSRIILKHYVPKISLGVLISQGQQTLDFYPTQLIWPCVILCVIVMAFNLLGDGLRDALDPRLRQ